jgi:cytochrome c556
MRVLVASAVLLVGAVVSAAWATTPAAVPPTPQQIIDARVDNMKKLGATIKSVSLAATTGEAKAKLREAIAISQNIVASFPKGTGIGDPGVVKTRALQEIWAKPAEFKAAGDALTNILRNIDVALDSGDKAKVDAAFGEVGKGCGGCHKVFRGPEL